MSYVLVYVCDYDSGSVCFTVFGFVNITCCVCSCVFLCGVFSVFGVRVFVCLSVCVSVSVWCVFCVGVRVFLCSSVLSLVCLL